MNSMYVCACVLMVLAHVDDVIGHGGMTEPPMRSVLWRESSEAPVNYDWNALYCGGIQKFKQTGGKCGLCGDPYGGPYENDKGGIYDKGIIVRHYPVGLREIEVKVDITAHHKGYMQFKLCPNNENPLTKACLDRYPLQIREGRRQGDPFKYEPPKSPKLHELHVILPPDVTCDRCVLQWTYTAGNSHGTDANGRSCVGCGLQETFVNCADISIGGTIDRIPVATNDTGPVKEVVIPTRTDTVDIIQNASPDTSVTEVLRRMDITWTQPASDKPRNQPPATRIPRPRTRQTVGPRLSRPRVPTSPPRKGRRLQNNRRQRERLAAMRRQRNDNNRRWSVQSRTSAQPDRVGSTQERKSPLKKAPARGASRAAKRNNARRGSSSVSSRARARQRPAASKSASLLDTMNKAIDDIRRNGKPHRKNVPDTNRRNNAPRKPTRRFSETGVNIFGDPITDHQFGALRERVPEGAQWRRSDGRASHRDAVRRSRQFGGINIPLRSIRKHVPELPLDILPQRDLDLMERRRASTFRDNWFPESRRASPPRKSRRQRLPRRIVVQSMMVAQHLLRKFPQLRGRVYLSREANRRNILAHMTQKYRLRQRWH